MRPPLRILAVAAGLGLLLATSACTSTPSPEELRQNALQPTGTPSPVADPISDPRGSREVVGEGYRLAADSAFQRLDLKSRNGQPMLVLRRASNTPSLPVQVAVLREPDPQQGVVEQSYALETTKRTLSAATDLSRSDVVWPGAERAVLVQWTENVPAKGGETVATRYWQLNVQASNKLILIVVGFAPAEEFDDSTVGDIVRTFRISA